MSREGGGKKPNNFTGHERGGWKKRKKKEKNGKEGGGLLDGRRPVSGKHRRIEWTGPVNNMKTPISRSY